MAFTGSARSLVDRPDDYQGHQVHVVYAVPRGGVDQQSDLTSRIPYSLAAANRWLESQIGRKVKFDTYQGALDIRFIQLPRTAAEYASDQFGLIRSDIIRSASPGKNTLVFYEGPLAASGACGNSEQATVADQTYLFSMVYIGCWGATASGPDAEATVDDFIPLHETFHAFGAGHPPLVSAEPGTELYQNVVCDLMYVVRTTGCTGIMRLDPYGREYYNPSGLEAGRVNTYHSPFLTPPP